MYFIFDLHIEDLLPSTPFQTQLRTENLLFDFQNQLGRADLNFDTSLPRSIYTLDPEQLADTGASSSTDTYILIPNDLSLLLRLSQKFHIIILENLLLLHNKIVSFTYYNKYFLLLPT